MSNPGLTSIKPTHYLLDYGDFSLFQSPYLLENLSNQTEIKTRKKFPRSKIITQYIWTNTRDGNPINIEFAVVAQLPALLENLLNKTEIKSMERFPRYVTTAPKATALHNLMYSTIRILSNIV